MGNVLKKYNLTDEIWEPIGGAITGDTLPIGTIVPYGSKETPTSWLACNGQAISRTTYADLFAIIGTQFGEGDGSTTFNLPDINKYRVPIGYDRTEEQSDRMNLGTIGGEEKHTMTIAEMFKHSHSTSSTMYTGVGSLGYGDRRTEIMVNGTVDKEKNLATNEVGESQPFNLMQPYVTTNYIIKAFQSSGVIANVTQAKTESDTDTYSCNYVNSQLDKKVNNDKIIVETLTIAENYTINARDAKVFPIPSKEGYKAYVLKPYVVGDWSDKYAVYVPYNNIDNFGILNNSDTNYTWNIYCAVMYIKN